MYLIITGVNYNETDDTAQVFCLLNRTSPSDASYTRVIQKNSETILVADQIYSNEKWGKKLEIPKTVNRGGK